MDAVAWRRIAIAVWRCCERALTNRMRRPWFRWVHCTRPAFAHLAIYLRRIAGLPWPCEKNLTIQLCSKICKSSGAKWRSRSGNWLSSWASEVVAQSLRSCSSQPREIKKGNPFMPVFRDESRRVLASVRRSGPLPQWWRAPVCRILDQARRSTVQVKSSPTGPGARLAFRCVPIAEPPKSAPLRKMRFVANLWASPAEPSL